LFYVFLGFCLFLIATSRHNTTNVLSHPAAAAAAIYSRAATAAAAAVEIPPKTRYKQKQNETHYENTTH
jgi:hypothetical protein